MIYKLELFINKLACFVGIRFKPPYQGSAGILLHPRKDD